MATASKKVIPIKPVTSWSFSRLNDYRTCPLKFKLKHIDRIKEPGSAAMDRGNHYHKVAENYVKGLIPIKMPEELTLLADEFLTMRKMYKAKKLPMIIEDDWAFKNDWTETQWNDWTYCWVRIKLDAAHYVSPTHMVITDWKTGKPNDYKKAEYMEQLDLYALASMLKSAVGDELVVEPRIGWLDQGTFFPDAEGEPVVYTRKDIPRLMKYWGAAVKPMFNDKTYPPKANGLCRFCFYGQAGKAKGGPGLCKF